MRSRASMALAAVLGAWTGAAGAGETIWEGPVRVIDARTLAGAPGGPELPLAGIEPPPSDARCGPAEERLPCNEIAEQVLRGMASGQHVVCEGDGGSVACRAGDVDVAEWMVRMGWAIATDERLRGAEREARAAREGMWWFEEERRLLPAPDTPSPTGLVPPHPPGEDVVRACARARERAFARREHGNLIGIEAAEWLIEETRLRRERRQAMAGDGAETPPTDPEAGDVLAAARKLCGALGGEPRADDGETAAASVSEGGIEAIERTVSRAADESRETCWQTAAGAARRGEVEILVETRQIARHTMLRTERLGERLWRAREQEDEAEARRALGLARSAFGNAGRRCRELAAE